MNRAFLFVLVALSLPAAARAQSDAWELNLHGGALRHDVFDESATDPSFGGRLARYTAGGWGIGAGVDYTDAGSRRYLPAGEPATAALDVDVTRLRYAFEVDRAFPARGRMRMALGAGVGGIRTAYDGLPGVANTSETNLMVPLSASLKLLNRTAGPSWGVVLGARDQMVFVGDEDPLGNPRDSEIAHQVQGTVGIAFYFGGGRKTVAERPRSETPPRAMPAPAGDADDRAARDRALASIRERIHFDFDRSDLKPEARETLRRKAEALRTLAEISVVIEGHADERGTVEYNLALGERRAKAALDYLADLGIDPERVSIVSYGEERPAAPGHDEGAWSQNRRDEFVPSES